MPIWPAHGLWRHHDFLRLWAAQAVSALGSRVSRTALPIIAILSLDASLSEQAILGALSVAPAILVGLVVGGRVDRGRKRGLLIGSDLMRAALIVSIPVAAWLGGLSVPQLYIVAALVGAATTVFSIADNSYLPALIDRNSLVEGNAKLETTEAIAEAAGPGLAGVLIQLLTAPVAMLLDAASYLWSALMLSRISVRESPSAKPGDATLLKDVAAGFAACWALPPVRLMLVSETLAWLFGGVFLALYMATALTALKLSPATAGLIISCGGFGAFAGALLAERLDRKLGAFRAMGAALLAGQAASLFIPLAVGAGALATPLLIAHQLVGDAFLTAYAIIAISLRQRELPAGVLGRSNATFHVLTGAALPAGALAAGFAAEAIGLAPVLWVGAIGGIVSALILAGPALTGYDKQHSGRNTESGDG